MADVVVVGAGISGVACARELRMAGIDVRLVERGHTAGGRMASRGLWDRRVDLGASYFTVTDPGFAAVVDDWSARGLAHEWTDTFCLLDRGDVSLKQGPVRWGAARGIRSLVEDLATDLRRDRHETTSLADLEEQVVVLAMPDPQARRLVGEHPVAEQLAREWEPVIALAARWQARTWDRVSPTGRFDGAFVHGDDVLDWIADDGRRRGDDAAVLVAHSTAAHAQAHLADPQAAGPSMLAALRDLLGLDEPAQTHAHRWTYARPAGERDLPYALAEGDRLVGVCGDGWGAAPKVETAWLSGAQLGRELAGRLSAT
ncbi:NAD(P)/FAD-dependent oxidoreductase [Nocardioides hwasunensis]|uniref:NAD(P)-binding protein n=1 Tax=Nocardioides hwasunensis TaxID=397258 RepID=A0ABR8MDT5_9ACTN|nr:FAD-dependent oxidoreductase [Nocardioides hwasunensis]MBD3914123.1 NAD(P)-binding protein [Nocardioides hwasunensis]